MYSAFAKKVKDVMTRGIVTVKFNAPLKEVVKTLAESDIAAIVAVDDRHEAMGVVSTIDVIKYLKDRPPEELKSAVAEDVMTPVIIHIDPTKTLKEAAELMIEKEVHRLVVLHPHEKAGKMPVGIISATDLIRELSKSI